MLNLVQITDTHLLENPTQVYSGRIPYEQLLKALTHAENNIREPKIFVISGDLVTDVTVTTYHLLSDLFNRVDSPVYIIPGNHDDGQLIKQHIVGKNIFHGGEIVYENWLMILLDSSTPGTKLGSGKLSAAELARLENILRENLHRDVIIGIHHPPLAFGAKWFQNICLENKDEFDAIINRYQNIKLIIFGHAHAQLCTVMHNRLYACAPSTWRQMDHTQDDHPVYTDMSGGYNWYRLEKHGNFHFGTNYF